MTQADLELARRVLAAFRNASGEAPMDFEPFIHPEIEMDTTRLGVPGLARLWIGPEEVALFWQSWLDAWKNSGDFQDPELIASEGLVVACFEQHEVEGTGSGLAVSMPAYQWVWSTRNGRIWRASIYLDRTEAFEAAGLTQS